MTERGPAATDYRPSIKAVPFMKGAAGEAIQLLSSAEQEALIKVSRLIRLPKYTELYTKGSEARYIYNIVSGVAETYHSMSNGSKRVTAFLFPHDLVGLAENGAYVSNAQSLTPLVAYQIPVNALRDALVRDPKLDFGLLSKLCHDLRRSQYHTLTVSLNEAAARVSSFLLWIKEAYPEGMSDGNELTLPMARHHIADYLGLSTESVSRALLALEQAGAIARKSPRSVVLADIPALAGIAVQGA
ncbi:Crp/Fnr family transcriptional regulator [Bordetella genomosp. 10]|uniref:Crp/Fnr family transcriptional regulator n=1 Tax=Bordetella genomosp. 10 TaxID=1416804 RepID=A0A261SAP5_9BORD|nr:Crp/Fnr family transcriptional regulator [Bordetella genomosp. 10]OZI34474.1 Crp/Fnr family transcriptional regulator [Bordetella genomosp. 10]